MAHIELQVQNPMTHTTAEGKFTSYLVAIDTNNLAFSLKKSHIRRRYSEFVWFRDTLAKNHPDIEPPALPPKTFFRDRFDFNLIEDRKAGLQKFLNGVVSETRYMSDNVVHLMLQSPLAIPAIEAILQNPRGQTIPEIITMHAEQAQGICNECNQELYPDDEVVQSAGYQENSSAPAPCPHDIFSPTRPHSFDFSHCVMGHSMSYDSSEEGHSHLANMAAMK